MPNSNTATLSPGEQLRMDSVMRQEKQKSRVSDMAKEGMRTGGGVMQARGTGMRVAGKGMQAGGRVMTQAGAALSRTGVGAIVGAPLAVAGGLTTATGKGVDSAGKAISKTGKADSLTTKLRQGRLAGALSARKKARSKVMEKAQAPTKMMSSRAWQMAWWSLIPSWGLSLIVLDILWFLSLVTGFVAKPGEEWIPKKALSVGGDAGKLAGQAMGIVERMGLIMLNFIAFIVIISIVVFIVWVSESSFAKLVLLLMKVITWLNDLFS